MGRIMRVLVVMLLASLPLAGCGSEGSSLPSLPTSASTDTQYRLGPGDKLSIKVLGAEDLSGDYTIGDNGTIATPLIGEVKAAGLTRAELEKAIADKLAQGYIKNPRVSVAIATYRPFYIFGEVTKPGEYPYASGMKVLNAIATAGGFTYRAQQGYVVVSRNGQEWRASPSSPLLPDDIVRVPERFF
jgi:polysaccharide export outer membrane protein